MDGGLQSVLPHPEQVADGAFGAGEDDDVRVSQLPRVAHVAHADLGVFLQRCEIGEVGDAGQAHHRRVQRLVGALPGQAGGQRVLVVHVHLQVGDHAQHRLSRALLQHGQAGAENVQIPPEFVDDKSRDLVLFLGLEQRHRAVQLGEHAAPVDVPGQQHRRVYPQGKAHVDDIVCAQVDFRRTARALDDDDVVFCGQTVKSAQHLGKELLFVAEILRRRHLPPDLAHDDDLTARVAAGLEQHGVHAHVRFRPRRLGLDHLGPAHFQAV